MPKKQSVILLPTLPDLDTLPSPKVIGVVGSRRRNTANDNVAFLAVLDRVWKEGDTLVSGGCPKGADNMAEVVSRVRRLSITIHYPDWRNEGKMAGLNRNTLIARDCDLLIALVSPDRSGGTEDTIRKCEKLGKPVVIVE